MKLYLKNYIVAVMVIVFASLVAGCSPKSSMPTPPEKFEKVTLHLYFDAEKADLHQNDHGKLDSITGLIKSYPGASVIIEGHTDNIGSRDANHTLSHKRADAVKNYLVSKGGLDQSVIETIGYGESRPIASNDTAAGREQNRRVDILIVPR